MQKSPYAPPKPTENPKPSCAFPVGGAKLGLYIAAAVVSASVGNYFAIFWGCNFEYWLLKLYWRSSLVITCTLLIFAIVLAVVLVTRLPADIQFNGRGFTALFAFSCFPPMLMFGTLVKIGLPDETLLLFQASILIATQVLGIAYGCYRATDSWFLIALFAFISATAGVAAAIFHIVVTS